MLCAVNYVYTRLNAELLLRQHFRNGMKYNACMPGVTPPGDLEITLPILAKASSLSKRPVWKGESGTNGLCVKVCRRKAFIVAFCPIRYIGRSHSALIVGRCFIGPLSVTC